MLTKIPLTLFTTSNCHLCEQAIHSLSQLGQSDQLKLVEIIDDESLLATYGTRIPVLQRADTLAELNWPFCTDDIMQFINNKKASI